MSPQEKAKELYKKYEFVYIQNYTSSYEVKQCAIIAVDEIISALEEYDNSTEKYLKEEFGYKDYFSAELQNMDSDFRYWSKVKYELETMKVS